MRLKRVLPFMTFVSLVLSLIFVSPSRAQNIGFALNIEDVSGLESPWPLTGSVAFPEGAIYDPSLIRIMSAGSEIPAQVDVAATWRDGSIRWAHAGFTAPPSGDYRVEFGGGTKRKNHPSPMKITGNTEDSFFVDTGAALYRFEKDRLLPEDAWLVSEAQRIQILSGSGAGAYLVDNSGRTSRVAGESAGVETKVLKNGPGRFVIKRSGWYVTEEEEKTARADTWMYFAQGSAYMRITHSIIFTEDTNKLWIRDYGLEFKTPDAPRKTHFAMGSPGDEVFTVDPAGTLSYMMQDVYPHFAERDCRAVIGSYDGTENKVMEEFDTAGDWAHAEYAGYGLTLAMPWLAERFPKEISFGENSARAVLWSGRSGRELDFRAKTLVEEYFKKWTPTANPGAIQSNVQGGARTHDIWLLPHKGQHNAMEVQKAAIAASRPPLALAETEWLCRTNAMGYPMLHRDTGRFPEEEKIISDFWDRLTLPLKAFPLNGFIAWGCYPSRLFNTRDGRFMMGISDLQTLREYGLRREPWRHYARSGERRYYDYGHRFSRFTGDWSVAHASAPGKERGGFTNVRSPGHGLPLFWGNVTHPFTINAGSIGHWLFEYYLTGDERSFDIMQMIKESFKEGWDLPSAPGHFHASGWRALISLAVMDWDEEVLEAARTIVREAVCPESQNGMGHFIGSYSPMYKDHRTGYNYLTYYLETGDELVKEAVLKLIDQRYRFDRRYNPATGHKNFDCFFYSVGYWLTGEERFRRVVEQSVNDMLRYAREYPLSGDLAKKPENPLDWADLTVEALYPGSYRLIAMRMYEYHNTILGLPTALKLLAEEGRSGKGTPVAVKPLSLPEAKILFYHEHGSPTKLSLTYLGHDNPPQVRAYPCSSGSDRVDGVRVETEKRLEWGERVSIMEENIYHASVTVPAETPGGLYLLETGEGAFTLHDISSDRAALYCPDGFWSVSSTSQLPNRRMGEGSYGRSGEGMPLFFRVPGEIENLEVFMSRPARIKRPDGTTALELAPENKGVVSVPVKGMGGVWSLEPYIMDFRGVSPQTFFRLINVEPVVAFGTPVFLPEGTSGVPAPVPQQVEPFEDVYGFSEGVAGGSLRVGKGTSLRFPRGEKHAEDGYAHFPGMAGTVEFWYRPDRATWERTLEPFEIITDSFLRAPHIELRHKYWISVAPTCCTRTSRETKFGSIQLVLSPGRTGQQSENYFRGGEWVHVAYTWDLKKTGENIEGDTAIFINGRKKIFQPFLRDITPLTGQVGWMRAVPLRSLADEGDYVELGPFEGCMDILRISDTVRYTDDFMPSAQAPQTDSHTRALFLFDGNLKGMSESSVLELEVK